MVNEIISKKDIIRTESLGVMKMENFNGIGIGMTYKGKIYVFPLFREEASMFIDTLIGEMTCIGDVCERNYN